jgi:hypothetical protein
MLTNPNVFRCGSISSSNAKTRRVTRLHYAFISAILVTLVGLAGLPSVSGADMIEKSGLASAQSKDYHTVEIIFAQPMDLTTVIPLNIKVTTRTAGGADTGMVLGTLGQTESFHPLTITGRPDIQSNAYWLTFSGEMLNNGLGIVNISNMKDKGGVLVSPDLFQWITGIGVAPTVSPIVAAVPTNPTGLSTIPFTVAFSEPVQFFPGNWSNAGPGLDFQDLVINMSAGMTYNTVDITGGPQTYTVQFTGVRQALDGTGKGTFGLAFKPSPTITDLAGNVMVTPITNSASVQIDQVKPNVTSVTCPSDPTNNPVFTVTFDKDVLGFNDPATDLYLAAGVNSDLTWTRAIITPVSARVYTVSFQGLYETKPAPLTIQVRTDSDIHDAGSNVLGTVPDPLTVTVDTVAPQATSITAPNKGPTSSSQISFNIDFNEPIYDLAASDLLVSGSGVTWGAAQVTGGGNGDTSFSAQVSGVGGNGTLQIRVKTGGSAHDLAGNKVGYSVYSDPVIIDHLGPQALSIVSQSGNNIQGGSVPFVVTFNESAKNFDSLSDLVITTTGSVSYSGVGFSAGPATVYTVSVAQISGEGTLTLAVNTKSMVGMVSDLSDNGIISSVTSAPINVDITKPRAQTITTATPSPTTSTSISYAVHFTEPVLNFTIPADLVINETGTVGHTGSTITPVPPAQDYTVTVNGVHGTGTLSLAANASVPLPALSITDLAGNSLDWGATSLPLVIDNTAPAVTVGVGAVNVTVISGHTHAATVDPVAGTWSIVWPETLPQGTYDVVATVTDTAGNTAGDSTTNELQVDLTAPTVTVNPEITGDRTPFVSGTVSDNVGVATVTFTVTISGVPHTYTAAVTGNAWNGQIMDTLPYVTQIYDIQVTATDTAGNIGNDTTTSELNYDINVPTIHVNTLPTNSSTPTITGTASFIAPATAMSTMTVTVHGHVYTPTLDPPVGNTQLWTANVTEILPEGIYDVAVQATDSMGRPGRDGTTNELTIDKQGPTATFAPGEDTPTNEDVVHMNVTFSEPLKSPLGSSGVVLTGTLGNAATVVVTDADPMYHLTYNLEITMNDPNADGTLGVGITPAVTDKALNAYVGGESSKWDISNWFGFTIHPQDAAEYNGDPHTFHVQASFGSSTPVYTWKWDNAAKTVQDIGTNSPDCRIDNVAGKDGTYWCEVFYNGVTYPSNKAKLFVAVKPSIVQQPQDASKLVGDRCDFSVVAGGGFPSLTYEWWKDGKQITNATHNSLSIARVTPRDNGQYQVIVTDGLGTPVASRFATLKVAGQPVPVAGFAGLAALAGAFALLGSRKNFGRKK